jgi:hypothetical protein
LPDGQIGPSVRERELTTYSGSWNERIYSTFVSGGTTHTNPISNSSGSYKLSGRQITVSEGHPFRSRSGNQDVGGPFYSEKKTIKTNVVEKNLRFSQDFGFNVRHETYDGPLLPCSPDSNGKLPFPPDLSSGDTELEELGAVAISRANPSNAIVDLSTALGEIITGGLPSLIGSSTWKDRISAAQKAGSEYLNLQFGWLPLVSEINSLVDVMRNADAVIRQYERDSGRKVRRRFDFPIEEKIEESVIPGVPVWAGGSGANFTSSLGTQVRRRSIWRRRWFSGAYSYYLPTGYDSRKEMDRVKLLTDRIGLSPNPETLWNLAPWSWAVDWFSNAGDVVANIQSFQFDGNVLTYGYMMENTVISDTYTLDGIHSNSGVPIKVQPLTLVTETKRRIAANPYGFGVSWDGLSAFQVSILTALGLTQGRR